VTLSGLVIEAGGEVQCCPCDDDARAGIFQASTKMKERCTEEEGTMICG